MLSPLRSIYRQDFYAFVRRAYAEFHGDAKIKGKYVKWLCQRLSLFATDGADRIVVNMPPRHLKTFVCSTCLPAYILGHNPRARIMVVSYGEELAREISRDIRRLIKSEWYKGVFSTRIAKDHSRAMDFATTKGGKVHAFSVEGGITGFGADAIIADDLLQIGDADNIDQIHRVNRIFNEIISSRLNDPETGKIIIVAHRLHQDDLSGHVLAAPGWDHLVLPFMATERSELETSAKRERHCDHTQNE